jgi:hypothetical protein
MIDVALAGGIREFSLCLAETMFVQLPSMEHIFELDIQQETEYLRPNMNETT